MKSLGVSFKPYYKWNTFNTQRRRFSLGPSRRCFKPYYKWNTFNTSNKPNEIGTIVEVLNLIINGIPSILRKSLEIAKVKRRF